MHEHCLRLITRDVGELNVVVGVLGYGLDAFAVGVINEVARVVVVVVAIQVVVGGDDECRASVRRVVAEVDVFVPQQVAVAL
ncbi:MAG: hypothetical protein K2H71_02165 [Muribaculaceae bacterium]|nr:hypothetical protein [Muribaculaceae bacterium]